MPVVRIWEHHEGQCKQKRAVFPYSLWSWVPVPDRQSWRSWRAKVGGMLRGSFCLSHVTARVLWVCVLFLWGGGQKKEYVEKCQKLHLPRSFPFSHFILVSFCCYSHSSSRLQTDMWVSTVTGQENLSFNEETRNDQSSGMHRVRNRLARAVCCQRVRLWVVAGKENSCGS